MCVVMGTELNERILLFCNQKFPECDSVSPHHFMQSWWTNRLESQTQTRRKCDIRSETIVDSEFDEKGPLIFYCKLERNGRISIHFVSPNAPT